jgi:hypothetical protein
MLPTTTFEIYDMFYDDEIIMDKIGIHRLVSGITRPALAHFWPQEQIEPTTTPEGVEIVIWRSPFGTDANIAETGEIAIRPTFQITITQWEPTAGGDFNQQNIIDRIQQLLPGANATDVSIDGLTTGLQQHTVTWLCPTFVLQS